MTTRFIARPASGGIEALRLLLAAAVLAAAAWLLVHRDLPFRADATAYELELSAPLVELAQARGLFGEGNYLFIDTRPEAGPGAETISGSFVIREDSFDDDLLRLMDVLYPEDPVVLFGDGNLMGVNNVAARLQTRGFSDVQILRSGLESWRQGGGDMGPPYIPEAPGTVQEGS